jgi:hypothetical protein
MNFDISSIEASPSITFDVEIGKRADGAPVGFRIVGPNSSQYQKATRALELQGIKESAARKGVLDMTTDEGAQVVIDGVKSRREAVVKACVVDWFGFAFGEGPAPFTQDNLDRVLAARPAWVVRLAMAIEDDANFEKG